MSIPSTRPYQNSAPQPFSPAITTASSLNYSAYGNGNGNGGRSAPASASAAKLGAIGRSESGLSQGSRGGKSETKETARIHWRALRDFLAAWLKDGTLCLYCEIPCRVLGKSLAGYMCSGTGEGRRNGMAADDIQNHLLLEHRRGKSLHV